MPKRSQFSDRPKIGMRSGPYTKNKGGFSGLPCGYMGYGAAAVSYRTGANPPIRTHQSRLKRTAKHGQPVQRHPHER